MASRRGEGWEVGVQSLAIRDPIRLCHVGHTRTDTMLLASLALILVGVSSRLSKNDRD